MTQTVSRNAKYQNLALLEAIAPWSSCIASWVVLCGGCFVYALILFPRLIS